MVGSVVTVGKRYAVVVRVTETEIAARFSLRFSNYIVKANVIPKISPFNSVVMQYNAARNEIVLPI